MGQRPHEDGSVPERHPPRHSGASSGRRHSRPGNKRRTHRKGDGSKPSHAYDYIFDEIDELNEELVDTEDTFGHDSDEVHEMLSKVRLLEKIQRSAKMLDQGMPQDEFDDLVAMFQRLAELRLFEHVNGPGSLRKQREREELGHPDPDDPDTLGYGDQHDEEYEAGKRERSQEMMDLGEKIREMEHHWKHIPKPMTHEATAEQRKEVHELYQSLPSIHDKHERKAVREKIEHIQQLIHDRRRHKDMDDEDREAIKALRAEALLAESDEEKREIREEIEDIYREHRRNVRMSKPHGHPEHSRPKKNYHDSDDLLQQLHDELHDEDSKDGRHAIRKKIRDRLHELRMNDPDVPDHQKPGYGHGAGKNGTRHRRSRGSDKLPKSKTQHHPIGSEKEARPYADTPADHPKAPGNDSPAAPKRRPTQHEPLDPPKPPERSATPRADRKRKEAREARKKAKEAENSE